MISEEGILSKAHNPNNVLLVWFYNVSTSYLFYDRDPRASHLSYKSEQFVDNILKNGSLVNWMRGRVFQSNDKNYLIVYKTYKYKISAPVMKDLLDKCEGAIKQPITRLIDEEGKNIMSLLEKYAPEYIETHWID